MSNSTVTAATKQASTSKQADVTAVEAQLAEVNDSIGRGYKHIQQLITKPTSEGKPRHHALYWRANCEETLHVPRKPSKGLHWTVMVTCDPELMKRPRHYFGASSKDGLPVAVLCTFEARACVLRLNELIELQGRLKAQLKEMK